MNINDITHQSTHQKTQGDINLFETVKSEDRGPRITDRALLYRVVFLKL